MLTLAAVEPLDWAVIAVYFLAMIAMGFWFSRGADNERGYVMANQSMPAWAVGLSLLATAFGSLDFIGNPQFAFDGDLSFLSIIFVGWIATFLIAWLLLPAFYKAKTLTIYGYLGQRFGPGARVAGGVMFLLGKVLTSGAGMFVASIAMGALIKQGQTPTLGELLLSIILVGSVGTLYTAVGGIRTVIWTDVVQILIIFGAGVYSVFWLLSAIPMDLGQMVHTLAHAPAPASQDAAGQTVNKLQLVRWSLDPADPYTALAAVFGGIVFFLASFGTDHNFTQRLLTCRSARRAGAAVIGGYAIGIVSQILFLSIGLLLFLYHRPELWGQHAIAAGQAAATVGGGASGGGGGGTNAGVFPDFIIAALSPGVTGLALAGLFAAMMSSFDSTIASIASSFMADLVRPLRGWRRGEGVDDQAWAERPRSALSTLAATAATGAGLTTIGCTAAIVYRNSDRTLIDFVLGIGSFPHGSLLGVFLAGVLTRRGNVRSVVAAMIAGVLVWIALQPQVLGPITEGLLGTRVELAWTWWTTIGTAVSFAVCCAGRRAAGEASDGEAKVTPAGR